MTPGPTIIRRCSVCLKLIKQHTIGSGNTFGATLWTDGKLEALMLPDQPSLVMCPHCHVPLWIAELEKLGETEPWADEQHEFKGARVYDRPTLDDYFALVEAGISDAHKELYVRVRAWWTGNDARRTTAREFPLSPREAANVAALADLLDETDSDELIMKAEIMRELGRFADALSLLAQSVDENTAQALAIIKELSENGDPYVRKLQYN